MWPLPAGTVALLTQPNAHACTVANRATGYVRSPQLISPSGTWDQDLKKQMEMTVMVMGKSIPPCHGEGVKPECGPLGVSHHDGEKRPGARDGGLWTGLCDPTSPSMPALSERLHLTRATLFSAPAPRKPNPSALCTPNPYMLRRQKGSFSAIIKPQSQQLLPGT